MIRADYKDKELIVDILTNSFNDNKSVNYIIKQDDKRLQRIRNLMDYSIEVCYEFGDVFLSNDKTGCALIVLHIPLQSEPPIPLKVSHLQTILQ